MVIIFIFLTKLTCLKKTHRFTTKYYLTDIMLLQSGEWNVKLLTCLTLAVFLAVKNIGGKKCACRKLCVAATQRREKLAGWWVVCNPYMDGWEIFQHHHGRAFQPFLSRYLPGGCWTPPRRATMWLGEVVSSNHQVQIWVAVPPLDFLVSAVGLVARSACIAVFFLLGRGACCVQPDTCPPSWRASPSLASGPGRNALWRRQINIEFGTIHCASLYLAGAIAPRRRAPRGPHGNRAATQPPPATPLPSCARIIGRSPMASPASAHTEKNRAICSFHPVPSRWESSALFLVEQDWEWRGKGRNKSHTQPGILAAIYGLFSQYISHISHHQRVPPKNKAETLKQR